ncbi:hypothetical protein GLUCOINTEAF2_0203764 [Komagataeibacter intermedius AF2]|uniref:Uncharacterized protein n=1 Tax=Komagataeibacter intermedius AF2 TaxID=1458464 RepID=A0A0N0MGC7_9PROT|nr:hypothetical protein GLUCOINTEAF2_0203764 [Komagataeibacter intermedius AF2]
MVEEVAIDEERTVTLVAIRKGVGLQPGLIVDHVADHALAEHHHVRAGIIAHRPGRKPDRPHEVSHLGDGPARGAVRLVQRMAGRHENCDAARAECFDGSGDEKVMQAQAKRPQAFRATHGAIGKGWITDRKVIPVCELRCREIFAADPLVRIEPVRNPCRNRIILDPGKGDASLEPFRSGRDEKTGPTAGFKHGTASEAHLQHFVPECVHDQFRGKMRILCRAFQSCPFNVCCGGMDRFANFFPAWAGAIASGRKQVVRQFSCSKANEA